MTAFLIGLGLSVAGIVLSLLLAWVFIRVVYWWDDRGDPK